MKTEEINFFVEQAEKYMENVSRCFCMEKDRKSKKQTTDIKGKMKREKKIQQGDTGSPRGEDKLFI